MHKVPLRGVAFASRQPARLIAGQRYPNLSASSVSLRTSRPLSIFPLTSNTPEQNGNISPETPLNGSAASAGENEDPNSHNSNGKDKNGSQGSTSRRGRNRKLRDLPLIEIPSWFLNRNVKLHSEVEPAHNDHRNASGPYIEVIQDESAWASNDDKVDAKNTDITLQDAESSEKVDNENQVNVKPESPPPVSKDPDSKDYRVRELLFQEIKTSLAGSLSSSSSDTWDSFATSKLHLKLHCPVDGAVYFLDRIVYQVASQIQADVVRLDAQDLAEIAGDYVKENSLLNLSYDAQQSLPKHSSASQAEREEEESEDENEEDAAEEEDENDSRSPKTQGFAGVTAIPLGSVSGGFDVTSIVDQFRRAFTKTQTARQPMLMPTNPSNIPGLVSVPPTGPNNNAQHWNDYKLDRLLEVLIETNVLQRSETESQREQQSSSEDQNQLVLDQHDVTFLPSEVESSPSEGDVVSHSDRHVPPSHKTIILLRGFKELSSTEQGRLIIEKLITIIQKRRKNQPIMIVGTSASSAMAVESSHTFLKELQSEEPHSPFRTIIVTPESPGPSGGVFYRDDRRRIREINTRHLHSMVTKLTSESAHDPESFENALHKDHRTMPLHAVLDDQLLSFDDTHRIAVNALGLRAERQNEKQSEEEDEGAASYVQDIAEAIRLLDQSDKLKNEWAREEQQLQNPPPETSAKPKTHTENHLKKIRKQCNRHERALLKGVVHTENIRTTFADVHAPEHTVESLKNLTMLSLTRPEAFKYGVLATDKITGCLLYGPPGTGKTLLAKAVAKESGATVLEVSGSDVNDMYVGESEKNVRAIFSLAKKLEPCVVFIDEADAIFASRGSSSSRTSHRELINQFLREWDGMTEKNAFIMVATNRPFDLDDAALRRLPRRLLVDLPTEQDREAILRIHLRDEKLNSSVSFLDLAAKTALYSGSDLKNVCVSAALAAVKEENDTAMRHNSEKKDGDPAFEFPEHRILEQKHFDKAMEEITASVSEDMNSLGAIRKFDEKYGDRRGRKKKSAYGFGGGQSVKQDTAKVRS